MKELLSKKFWQDVKKTFDEAQQDSPPKLIDANPEELSRPSEEPGADVATGDVPSPS